jgi:hypothetical protein
MWLRAVEGKLIVMPCFLIHHRHEPRDCGVVFAAFKGHDSPLRRRPTLALLPFLVARRATATRVRAVEIP